LIKKAVPVLLLFFFILSPRLFSLDLELIGGLGNLAFDHDRTSSLGAEDKPFEANWFPLAFARLSGEFNSIECSIGFEREDLLRNRLFANVRASFNYFFLEAGPVLGVFNSSSLPINPGVSAGLGFIIPGIVFAEASGSSTIGILMDIENNYIQRTGNISAGFWVPHVVCSLNMNLRYFTQRETADILIEDKSGRYFFRADVYTKNVPFGIRVDLGYQSLSRSYSTQYIDDSGPEIVIVKDTETDELKSIFMGLELSYTLNESLKVLLGGEMPVYSWPGGQMKAPSKSAFLFEARAGVIWTIIK